MFHTTASETVNSFADLLSTAASDIIDWAPPGKVAKWNQQLQTASRRSKDDVQEERLRREAGGICGGGTGVDNSQNESSPLCSDGGSTADATGIATSSSTRSTNSGRAAAAALQPPLPPDAASSSPFSQSYGAAAQWGSLLYRGLINGLLGLQSQSTATVYQTSRFCWNVGCVSSVNVSGFPFGFDAAWRATHLVSLLPKRRDDVGGVGAVREANGGTAAVPPLPLPPPLATLLTHTQWQTPVQNFWPSSFVALLRSARFDASLRVDNRLILCNLCVNARPAVLRTSTSASASTAPPTIDTRLAAAAASSATSLSEAAQQRRWRQWWTRIQSYGGWIRQVRGGLGLAIRGDFASGVNVFTGLTIVTEGNLHAAYHIDVLRRLTCSVAGPLWTTPASSSTSPSSANHSQGAAAVGAVRLMLNTITFEHSTLEAGASVPIAPSISALIPSIGRHLSWWNHVPHDVLLHVSTSTAGVMLGLQVQHAERYLAPYLSESLYRRLLSDARVDVTGGLAFRAMVPASGAGNSSSGLSNHYRSPTGSVREVPGGPSATSSSGGLLREVGSVSSTSMASANTANGVGRHAATSPTKPRRSFHSASFLLLTFQ